MVTVYKCENAECKEQELQLVESFSVGSSSGDITYHCPKCGNTYSLGHLENQAKLTELLTYFKAQKPEYEVTKRHAFDERATRFAFVKGKNHFMLDLSNNLIADRSMAEVKKQLEKSGWWAALQSHPAPDIVTFSSKGLSF
jgi:predicted nucleic-acid-binding Zn-ribbon protein